MKKFLFLILLFCNAQSNGQNTLNPKNKAPYKPEYTKIKDLIPTPILEQDSCWLEMYRYCWEEAFKKIKSPAPPSGFVSDYIDEGFNPNIFMWDTQFMILFWKYACHIFPAIQSNDNFYIKQHTDGYICREIREADGRDVVFMGKKNTVNPPLFAYAELEYAMMSGDTERLTKVLPVLSRQADWITANRIKKHSAHGLFWQKRFGSGMDNCPRKGNGWVDMSAQMVNFYNSIVSICELTGNTSIGNKYRDLSSRLGNKINQWMWNEKDGMYYDVKNNGRQVKNTTIAAFWSLFAGICSRQQSSDLVRHLCDTIEFWRKIPFPSIPANHRKYYSNGGDYWKGGVWAPTDYIIVKGLENNGFYDIAYYATEKLLNGMYGVFKKTATVWENYSPESYNRGNRSKGKFVGWTGLVPITMLIENIIGIRVNALKNSVTWHINRVDRHGIRNLHSGKNTITLVCEKRNSKEDKVTIHVECKHSFTLKIILGETSREIMVKEGRSSYTL